MTPTRIKRHRARAHTDSHMALVPFIDMMTILVVFLLVHTSDVDMLPNTKNISIPVSVSEKKPRETVVVMVTKDEILVSGELVARIDAIAASPDLVIKPLTAALRAQSSKSLLATDNKSVAEREVTIMGDRSIPYAVLKKIMATCTDADFGKVSLAVVEREGPSA